MYQHLEMMRVSLNRPDLLKHLREALAIFQKRTCEQSDTIKEPQRRERRLRLNDRYTAKDQQVMINRFTAGETAASIAHDCGVSLESIKRLLRRHGVRRNAA